MITSIALRELRSMFSSPFAWLLLAIIQLILSLVFFYYIEHYLVEIQPASNAYAQSRGVTYEVAIKLLDWTSVVMLIITPFLTMGLISGERRNNSLSLLLSSPINMTQIILGKYISVLIFILIIILMINLMPLSLMMGTDLDLGKLSAGSLGVFLLASAYASAGLYFSTLTSNQVIAAISTFGFLFLLQVFRFIAFGSEDPDNLFDYLSATSHLISFFRGLVDSKDVSYFLIFIITFLSLSIKKMDSLRLQG